MKTSVKLSGLATEIENLCVEVGYDFNESLDHQFAEIRREIEKLESGNNKVKR